MSFMKIKKGKPFTAFNTPPSFFNNTGAMFEAFDDDRGYIFAIYLPQIKENEIDIFSDSRIETRIVKSNNIAFPLFRFGKSDLLFDIIFNPFLYNTNKGFQMIDTNNHVLFVLIESSTNIVKSMRYTTMPTKLRELWSESWSHYESPEDFTQAFNKGKDALFAKSLTSSWREGISTSYFGVIEQED